MVVKARIALLARSCDMPGFPRSGHILLKISSIATAQEIHIDRAVDYLHVLIEEHHTYIHTYTYTYTLYIHIHS